MHNLYYKHIDGLRALAVISVFLCHLDFTLFKGGFVGVDVFFVISGFLITNIITQQLDSASFNFLNFYARRVQRIFPALFFTLFLSLVAGILLLNAASFIVFGKSLAFAALSVSNIFFKNQAGYFDVFSQSNPLLHTWSLGVEEQFYIFFPLVLFLGCKFLRKKLVTIALFFTISFGLNLYYQNTESIALYYLAQYRAFEFCIGAFVVFLLKYELNFIFKEILCFLGLGLILTAIFTYSSEIVFPSYNALMPCIGAALVIYAGAAKYAGYLFRCTPARQLGLISYSFYLIHWPLITFLKTYHLDCGLAFELGFNEKILVIAIALLTAFFMYYFIEQPFRKTRHAKKNISLKPIAQGLSVALVVACFGVFIGQSHGWVWRVNAPAELLKIDDISQYHLKNWGGAEFSGGLIHQGETGHAQIVMMGDSHVGMLDEGMVHEIAQPFQLTVFTVSGGGAGKYASSLLIPGITRLDKNQKLYDASARVAYKEALSRIHATNEQSVLMLSAFWSMQLDKAAYLKDHRSLNINTSSMTSYQDFKPLFTALDKLLNLLGNKKLLIIGDVPGSQYRPMDCWGGLKWFKQTNCSLLEDESLNKAALHVNKVLAFYASQKKNVYFLNPYEVFCKKGLCRTADSLVQPYYSDGTHLSKEGSKFLMSHFKDKILDILNSPVHKKQE